MNCRAVNPVVALFFAFPTALVCDSAITDLTITSPEWVAWTGHLFSLSGRSDLLGIILLVVAIPVALTLAMTDDQEIRRRSVLALKIGLLLFMAIVLSGIAVQLFKTLIGRARPVYYHELGAFHFQPLTSINSFKSFPSGHSTTIGALATWVAWVFPRQLLWWCGLASLGGAARVLAGAHYPSDVIVGLALGSLVTTYVIAVLTKRGFLPDRASNEMVRFCRGELRVQRNAGCAISE